MAAARTGARSDEVSAARIAPTPVANGALGAAGPLVDRWGAELQVANHWPRPDAAQRRSSGQWRGTRHTVRAARGCEKVTPTLFAPYCDYGCCRDRL